MSTRDQHRIAVWKFVVLGSVVNVLAVIALRVWHPYPFREFGTDFYTEALGPLRTLAHGHLLAFARSGPAYSGSLLMRVPVALPAIWLRLDQQTICLICALPALLAAPLLSGWLWARSPNRYGAYPRLTLLLIAFNPVGLWCVASGHAEDCLVSCLAILAVVHASEDKGVTAGVFMALAVIGKPWAAVAAPALLVADSDRRRMWWTFAVMNVGYWGPFILVKVAGGGSESAIGAVASSVGQIAYPWQLFYWFGPHSLISQDAHPLIVIGGVLIGLAWVRRRSVSRGDRLDEALWLLALLLLIRAIFDPWDLPYYLLPCLMTVMAVPRPRMGVFAFGASFVGFFLTTSNLWLGNRPNLSAALFSAVALPCLVALGVRVFGRPTNRWIGLAGSDHPALTASDGR